MKALCVMGAAALLVAATAPVRPAFEYREYVAGQAVGEDRLAPCRPKPTSPSDQALAKLHPEIFAESDPDLVVCSNFDATVAGMKVLDESVAFYKGRLSSVQVMLPVAGFGRVVDAFRAKYGKPCRAGSKSLQTISGAKIDSPYFVWCFATGELTADMYYPDLETSNAEYRDKNQPPAAKAKVDF